jgi:ABC-2 type transport system ATP-binding protein
LKEVLAAEGLCKRFGATEALRGVTFSVEGPQVVGILGPNGAGKTTLLEILEGISPPGAGSVRLFGAPLRASAYPRRRVGVVLQREFALDRITAGDYAELFAAIFGTPAGDDRILRMAGLEGRRGVPVERLSGGEAARLFIAAAVVHDPDLVFLDEPTAHLDPENKARIGDLVRAMGRSRTVVMTTHDLREADAVCDHVIFLVEGRIEAQGPRADLLAAVPAEKRRGRGLEDAFFHFCAAHAGGGEA